MTPLKLCGKTPVELGKQTQSSDILSPALSRNTLSHMHFMMLTQIFLFAYCYGIFYFSHSPSLGLAKSPPLIISHFRDNNPFIYGENIAGHSL